MNTRTGIAKIVTAGLLITATAAFGRTTQTDAEMRSRAQDKLYHEKVGPNVQVKVEDAVATLEGVVDSIGLKEKAAKAISKVDGITDVANNLQVVAANDDSILKQAGKRIRTYAYYSIFDDVALQSLGGHLVLTGHVTQPWRKSDIENLVETIPGVQRVENKLEVLPLSSFDDQIRLRVARAIYRDPVLSRYAIQANPPIHIVVKNGNVRLTGVVNNAVEKAVAQRAARFAATYFNLENDLVVESEMPRPRM
jgi:hyperosmotically inducible periplasmic protein